MSIIAGATPTAVFGHIRPDGARELSAAVNRKCFENLAMPDFQLDIGLPPRQVLRCGRARQYGRDLHRAADALRPAFSGTMPSRVFGGGDVDIQRPVPACADWSQLETLAKEREMIGSTSAPARRLQDHHQPHVCRRPNELENLESYQGRRSPSRVWSSACRTSSQDRQAVGQICAGGLQRHA